MATVVIQPLVILALTERMITTAVVDRYSQADKHLIVNCCELGEPSSKLSRMHFIKDYYELTYLEVKASGYN